MIWFILSFNLTLLPRFGSTTEVGALAVVSAAPDGTDRQYLLNSTEPFQPCSTFSHPWWHLGVPFQTLTGITANMCNHCRSWSPNLRVTQRINPMSMPPHCAASQTLVHASSVARSGNKPSISHLTLGDGCSAMGLELKWKRNKGSSPTLPPKRSTTALCYYGHTPLLETSSNLFKTGGSDPDSTSSSAVRHAATGPTRPPEPCRRTNDKLQLLGKTRSIACY